MRPLENLSYIVWNIDPRIIPNFDFLRWYSLFWVVGILGAFQVMVVIFKKEQLSQSKLDILALYVIFGIILGARFGHVLFYDPIHYWNNPIEILPIRIEPHFQFVGLAGLASHGGVIGALIGLYLYNRKYKGDYLWILDKLTIAAALLGGFIRLGNLMNSEIIGIPTSVPWAFVFTNIDNVPRHPSQLYEAIFYFGIFALLFGLWKSGKLVQYKGLLFGLGIALIFVQRYLIEYVKENQVVFEKGMFLNMGQVLSVPMVLVGIVFIVRSTKRS